MTTDSSTLAREQFPVLVHDAQERMSIAVIRSLGRAGYPVHACSNLAHAAGLRSRFLTQAAACPPAPSGEFADWLQAYCERHGIRCIVPTETLALSIRSRFPAFAGRLPLPADESRVFQGINKYDLFDALLAAPADDGGAGAHLPALRLLRRGDPALEPAHLAGLRMPLFIKADAAHACPGEAGATRRASDVDSALAEVRDLLARFDRLVVQGYVPHVGVGAFVLRWNGRTLARFMHQRLHEIPLQGWSSYRRAWWHEAIMRDAEAKLEHLGWQGVAMLEYRWDPASDAFALIEMNGRFWGSLHLPLYAGVDFPLLLLDAFRGAPVAVAAGPGREVASRDPFLEARYVLSRLRDPGRGLLEKLATVLEFARLTLDPRVKSDALFPGDRALALWQCYQYLANRTGSRRAGGRRLA